ncbi:MAG: recombinase family protein [Nitrospirales bacterium]
MTLRKIAEELNQRNIQTARGGRWHATRLVEMLKRMSTRALALPGVDGLRNVLPIVGALGVGHMVA